MKHAWGFGVSSAVIAASALVSSAYAQEATRRYDIPAGELATALRLFGEQSDANVLFDPNTARSERTEGIRGDYTRDNALAALLKNTRLTFRLQNGAIIVAAGDASRPTELGNADPAIPLDEVNRVVVVGTNIRGVYPSSSPVEVYTAKDIERTGATTTAQFMEKLPQNLGSTAAHGSRGANPESVTSPDLRGLGPGTTLVLLNGRRLPLANRGQGADVSLIPASAIERVEVLTDGASAIYGSDAIGGVINFVLRDDFEGAETRLTYGGVTSGGMRQGGVAQTLGDSWGSGNGLISYDYTSTSALDRTERDFSRPAAPGTLSPQDQSETLFGTFSQNLTSQLRLDGDAAISRRVTKTTRSDLTPTNPLNRSRFDSKNSTDQNLANIGLTYDISDDWSASFIASYGETEADTRTIRSRFNNPSLPPTTTSRLKQYSTLDLTAALTGRLYTLPAGDVRFSVGGGSLEEHYSGENRADQPSTNEIGRRTSYAYGEVFAPLISPVQSIPFAERLELSIAARYTRFDDESKPSLDRDFGEAVDPKIGLLWAPISSLSLRGTYGTSFRAPSLLQLDPSSSSLDVIGDFPIPFPGGTPSTLAIALGVSPNLDAESAESYTLGFDYRTEALPGLRVGFTYYDIDYTDRIAVPVQHPDLFSSPNLQPDQLFRGAPAAFIENLLRTSAVIFNDSAFDLTNPTAAAATLAADPNFWVLDQRLRNLASSHQTGFDLSVSSSMDTALGQLTLGSQITRILDYKQQNSSSDPQVTVVDTDGAPADLRGRVFAGLSHGPLDTTLSVNYTDDYENRRAPSGTEGVGAWTTVDLSASYDFGAGSQRSMFDGVRVNFSVQNLFDEDPPFVNWFVLAERFGFDPINANPLGRFVVIGVSKQW